MKSLGAVLLVVMALLTLSNAAAAQSSEGAHAALHVAGGTAMSAVVGDVTRRPWLGLLTTVVAGMAKESYDYRVLREPGRSSVRDAATVSAGAVLGYLIARRAVARQRRTAAARLELQPKEPAGERPDRQPTGAASGPAWSVRR